MSTTDAQEAGRSRFGNRRVGAACTTCPTPVRVHIHLDANRDGEVDDRWWLNGSWTPGQGRLGAVVLCNCDDEDGDKEEDHANNRIDGAGDEPDIAPFHLRKHPAGARVPAGWKVVVEVLRGRESLFRIFHRDQAGGTQILGPDQPSHRITDLSRDEWRYGMETNQYPGRIKDPDNEDTGALPPGDENCWDGAIDVRLTLLDDADVPRDSEVAKIRCAPWVVFNHMDPTEELYVARVPADMNGPNAAFIAELDAATGLPAVQFPDEDRWMQDVMEIGFSTLPRRAPSPDMHLPVPLRTKNAREDRGQLGWFSKTHLLGRNYGYYEALKPQGGFSSLDSFGNLECVPPFVHPQTRVDYKFGRVIYGHSGRVRDMAREVTDLLRDQKVQFPIPVDTGWLAVGHIDEVLSFVPTPDGALGFKAVFASPARALELIRGRPGGPGVPPIPALRDETPVLRGITDYEGASFVRDTTINQIYWAQTVGELMDTSQEPNNVSASEYAQTKIDEIKQALRDEVGMTDDDFIDLPVLFQQVQARENGRRVLKCIAYTAGSANMLVVTRGPQTRSGAREVRLIVPKPFGPTLAPPGATGSAAPPCVFEIDIAEKLRLTGVTHVFIDNFATYHAGSGEIHCGTNSKRRGPIDRFWWEQEGI